MNGTGGTAMIGRNAVGKVTTWRMRPNVEQRCVEFVADGTFNTLLITMASAKLARGETVGAVIVTAADPTQRPARAAYRMVGTLLRASAQQVVLRVESQTKVEKP